MTSLEIGVTMRVEVDLDKCTGHGICESIAEDVFEVQDDGTVRIDENERPESDRDRMQQAVTQCPAALCGWSTSRVIDCKSRARWVPVSSTAWVAKKRNFALLQFGACRDLACHTEFGRRTEPEIAQIANWAIAPSFGGGQRSASDGPAPIAGSPRRHHARRTAFRVSPRCRRARSWSPRECRSTRPRGCGARARRGRCS